MHDERTYVPSIILYSSVCSYRQVRYKYLLLSTVCNPLTDHGLTAVSSHHDWKNWINQSIKRASKHYRYLLFVPVQAVVHTTCTRYIRYAGWQQPTTTPSIFHLFTHFQTTIVYSTLNYCIRQSAGILEVQYQHNTNQYQYHSSWHNSIALLTRET